MMHGQKNIKRNLILWGCKRQSPFNVLGELDSRLGRQILEYSFRKQKYFEKCSSQN